MNNNLLKGIYLYSYAIDFVSANKEADFVLSKLKQYDISTKVIVYYDLDSVSLRDIIIAYEGKEYEICM